MCKEKESIDPEPFIARSTCFLRLGMTEKAVEDAEDALKMDKSSVISMQAKAEAMYQLGEFEQALIQYERMLRVCPDYMMHDIEKRRNICVDTIKIAFQDYSFDLSLLEATLREVAEIEQSDKNVIIDCDQIEAVLKRKEDENIMEGANRPAFKQLNQEDKGSKCYAKHNSNQELMGKLLDDAIFLEKLANNVDFERCLVKNKKQEDVGRVVKNHAREAVIFFEKKKEFWMECSQMKSKKSLKQKRT